MRRANEAPHSVAYLAGGPQVVHAREEVHVRHVGNERHEARDQQRLVLLIRAGRWRSAENSGKSTGGDRRTALAACTWLYIQL